MPRNATVNSRLLSRVYVNRPQFDAWPKNVVDELINLVVRQVSFYCIALNAVFAEPLGRVRFIQVGDNEYLDIFAPLSRAHQLQYLIARYFRQHQIQKHQARTFFFNKHHSLYAVMRDKTNVAQKLKPGLVNISQAGIIFHNYDFRQRAEFIHMLHSNTIGPIAKFTNSYRLITMEPMHTLQHRDA